MRIEIFQTGLYKIPLTNGLERSGLIIGISDEKENKAFGECAPLPKWSFETLEDCISQFRKKIAEIENSEWTDSNWQNKLSALNLYPSLSFGFESALLSLLSPLPKELSFSTSALLMGSPQEILKQAAQRSKEGFTYAKLKVSHLDFKTAESLIVKLKDVFRLRIDVNRAWDTLDSLRFFSKFSLDAFDYVEEPFKNPLDLERFEHPLAVDESFQKDLSLDQLEKLPSLKALIYKPTIQGGVLQCFPLHNWAQKKGISLVLSSCFESDLALSHVASLAHRLSIKTASGIGTYYYLKDTISLHPLKFSGSIVHIPDKIQPKRGLKDIEINNT